MHSSIDPNGMYPHVLRELAAITKEPPSIIFERLWWLGNVLWLLGKRKVKKQNVTVISQKDKKDDLVIYWRVCLTSVPGKMIKQILLESISKHFQDKELHRCINLWRKSHVDSTWQLSMTKLLAQWVKWEHLILFIFILGKILQGFP